MKKNKDKGLRTYLKRKANKKSKVSVSRAVRVKMIKASTFGKLTNKRPVSRASSLMGNVIDAKVGARFANGNQNRVRKQNMIHVSKKAKHKAKAKSKYSR